MGRNALGSIPAGQKPFIPEGVPQKRSKPRTVNHRRGFSDKSTSARPTSCLWRAPLLCWLRLAWRLVWRPSVVFCQASLVSLMRNEAVVNCQDFNPNITVTTMRGFYRPLFGSCNSIFFCFKATCLGPICEPSSLVLIRAGSHPQLAVGWNVPGQKHPRLQISSGYWGPALR